MRRQSSRLFEQKNSFATLRDLFRWANRPAIGDLELARNGYLLLAERVRRDEDKLIVRKVLETVMKVDLHELTDYTLDALAEYQSLFVNRSPTSIVWTRSMRRLFLLVVSAFRNREPVLLVGETGCGKTTICQQVANALHTELQTLNAHQNTETADLIGALRPVRDNANITASLKSEALDFLRFHGSEPDNTDPDTLRAALSELKLQDASDNKAVGLQAIELDLRIARSKTRFEWADGPLVQSLKDGSVFLIDEISLADDAVLERLNSVLELKRTLVLAEKGGENSIIVAHNDFQICATMNPGGDFGKKELSPALRNRFTEIWVPAMSDDMDVLQILEAKLPSAQKPFAPVMLTFAKVFSEKFATSMNSSVLSIRDLLSWCQFCSTSPLPGRESFVQGAAMVYIDALSLGGLASQGNEKSALADLRTQALAELSRISAFDCTSLYHQKYEPLVSAATFSIGPFAVLKGQKLDRSGQFHLNVPTTFQNATRVLRAMQLAKPILLEGSPGVGKTSLVSAIADLAQRHLIRINLCEQTDLVDLFGSDAPIEDGSSLAFGWRDAPFLQAMQSGAWVLLDEMNLASQSILEGLNACLDHRGEAFIPELNRTFSCHKDFRIFAAQNPHSQGGGRKGLPKSFINRFTVVYCDPLDELDVSQVCTMTMPGLPSEVVHKIVEFTFAVERRIHRDRTFASAGRPWEFNLRDVLRWLSILQDSAEVPNASYYADFIIRQRMRTESDREIVDEIVTTYFGDWANFRPSFAELTTEHVIIGRTNVSRNQLSSPTSLSFQPIRGSNRGAAEAMLLCIKRAWPCLLVGSSGSGKTSLIQSLGSLLGHSVHTIAMNSDMDASDLLGSFEQRDSVRAAAKVFSKVSELIKGVLRCFRPHEWRPELCKLLDDIDSAHFTSELVSTSIDLLKSVVGRDYHTLILELEQLAVEMSRDSPGQFQWVDGSFVSAAQQGAWVILDNANLCDSSVLDRLNSLLEFDGQLVINEHILPDGSAKILRPGRTFRLFLTVDPSQGELSRAMRNRCVEVFLPTPTADSEGFLRSIHAEQALWYSVKSATELAISETHQQELAIAEAILVHLPRDLQTRRIPSTSSQRSRILDLVLELYSCGPVHEFMKAGASTSTVRKVLDSSALVPYDAYSPETLHEDGKLRVAVLGYITQQFWSDHIQTDFSKMISKLAYAELNILYSLATAILTMIIRSLESSSPHGVQANLSLLLLLQFYMSKSSFYGATNMTNAMLRRILKVVQRSDDPVVCHPDIIQLLTSSVYCQNYKTSLSMQTLWLTLRPTLPVSGPARLQFDDVVKVAGQIDEAIWRDHRVMKSSIALKTRCIATLRDLSLADSTWSAPSPEIITHEGIQESTSSSVLTEDSQYRIIFGFFSWKAQLTAICAFETWKESEAVRKMSRALSCTNSL